MTSFRIVKEGLRPTPFSTQLLEVFLFFPLCGLDGDSRRVECECLLYNLSNESYQIGE